MLQELSASNVASVTTSGTTVTYCVFKGSNATSEYIDYVAGSWCQHNWCQGYGNFIDRNVPYGSNTILFSAGFSGSHTLNIGKYGLIITKWCFETENSFGFFVK
jgi:hypothetical protein